MNHFDQKLLDIRLFFFINQHKHMFDYIYTCKVREGFNKNRRNGEGGGGTTTRGFTYGGLRLMTDGDQSGLLRWENCTGFIQGQAEQRDKLGAAL